MQQNRLDGHMKSILSVGGGSRWLVPLHDHHSLANSSDLGPATARLQAPSSSRQGYCEATSLLLVYSVDSIIEVIFVED